MSLALAGCLLPACLLAASAQAQPAAERATPVAEARVASVQARELQRAVRDAQVREVRVVRPDVVRVPDLTVRPGRPAPDLEVPDDATVSPPRAPRAPPPVRPPATPAPTHAPVVETGAVVAADRLLAGRLYRTELDGEQEATARQVLARQFRVQEASSLTLFPGTVRQVTEDACEVVLKPFVLAGAPLAWDPAARRYVGSLKVGLSGLGEEARSARLSAPMMFEVLQSGVASPERGLLDRISPPTQDIRISTPTLSDPFELSLLTNFDPSRWWCSCARRHRCTCAPTARRSRASAWRPRG